MLYEQLVYNLTILLWGSGIVKLDALRAIMFNLYEVNRAWSWINCAQHWMLYEQMVCSLTILRRGYGIIEKVTYDRSVIWILQVVIYYQGIPDKLKK